MARRAPGEQTRRDEILEAARLLFQQKGYDAAAVSDIVREAGIAQETFYLYFPSKKAVVFALADQYLETLQEAVYGQDLHGLPVAERVRAMVTTAFRVAAEHRDLLQLLHLGVDSQASEWKRRSHARARLTGPIEEILGAAIAAGEIDDCDVPITARLIQGLVEQAGEECFLRGDGSDAPRYQEALIAFIVKALGR